MTTHPSRLQGPRPQLVGEVRASAAAELTAEFDALAAHPKGRFYVSLGVLTCAFMSVDAQGFDMLA